ncbi:MgtC/SapB family protein [Hydrogenimonas sp.]
MNPDLIHFVVTVAFSFLTGLEVRTYRERFHPDKPQDFFGTARTYTFIGILGFVFYKIDTVHLVPYTAVLAGLTLLYALFYHRKLIDHRQSILLFLVMLCVYAFGPLTQISHLWMPSLLFVLIVFILNAREAIHRFTLGINPHEFETLGKMVLLSAVILPLLPNENIVPFIPLSPFKIWLAVVVVSAISYGGYITQKYFFPERGYFLTGLIGGTYSSTATTVVLARKSKQTGKNSLIDASIIAATSVMYLRLIVIALLFNTEIGKSLILPFLALSFAGFFIALFFLKNSRKEIQTSDFVDKNPLELGTAFIFALLFVVMMILTQYITEEYGSAGLEIFSFVVGFTDIDPFVLSLLTGKYSVTSQQIIAAIMIAAGSNNLLKSAYALWFGSLKSNWRSALVVALLGLVTIGWALRIEHLLCYK